MRGREKKRVWYFVLALIGLALLIWGLARLLPVDDYSDNPLVRQRIINLKK